MKTLSQSGAMVDLNFIDKWQMLIYSNYYEFKLINRCS